MRNAFDRPVEIGLPFRLAAAAVLRAARPRRSGSSRRRRLRGRPPRRGSPARSGGRLRCAGMSSRTNDQLRMVTGPVSIAFIGLLGQRLRVLPPFDRHRLRPRHVAEQDRRPDVARAVGLHPAMLGEGEACELLAEILHHVVALELAMHEHVEPDILPASAPRARSGSAETVCRRRRSGRPWRARRGRCGHRPSAGTSRWSWSGRPAG